MSEKLQIPRIKKLSSSLANQIAAGEVIERPASVLKELLENCLDAAATRIVVEVSKAGCEMIRVTDNGHGIHPEDLQLALERHATAKLNSQSDLSEIYSLGFRGEALPSISSVANFTITSRIAGVEQATRLCIDPATGNTELTPAAHPIGTTVEVTNLFHNTPARKKFLRSDRTEFLHIQETARRLALSRFNFSLTLGHNKKRVFHCRAGTNEFQPRVAAVMGQTFVNKAIVLEHLTGDMRLWGWLGVGELGRSSTDRQYLYLNGRMIHDQRLNHAIRVACEGQIATGRFPSYVLYLEMDATAADVNVHPSKHEVRFHQARNVHDFIYAGLLSSINAGHDLYAGEPGARSAEPESVSPGNEVSHSAQRQNIVGESRSIYRQLSARNQFDLSAEESALGRVLMQINQSYILTQRDDELLLINIEAAKMQIAEYKFNSVNPGESLTGRPLLVPVTYEISAAQEENLLALAPILEDFSLQLELTGPGRCRLRNIPYVLANADIALLLDDILKLKITALSKLAIRQGLIKIMTAHVVDIPEAGMSDVDMTNLLRQLQDTGVEVQQRRCPPIWTTLDSEDLERLIGRHE